MGSINDKIVEIGWGIAKRGEQLGHFSLFSMQFDQKIQTNLMELELLSTYEKGSRILESGERRWVQCKPTSKPDIAIWCDIISKCADLGSLSGYWKRQNTDAIYFAVHINVFEKAMQDAKELMVMIGFDMKKYWLQMRFGRVSNNVALLIRSNLTDSSAFSQFPMPISTQIQCLFDSLISKK